LIQKKAEYLKQTAVILKEKYDSDVPDTMSGLCSLPGIGTKMANLSLQVSVYVLFVAMAS